jgi:hypothetical protein
MATRKHAIAEIGFDGGLTVVATYASPADARAHLGLASRFFPNSTFRLVEGWF